MRNYSQNELRYMEDKNVQKEEYKRIENRVAFKPTLSVKKSLLHILLGFVFAGLLTLAELAIKNPSFEGPIVTLFKIVFYVSFVGTLLLPYGIYNFIISFKRQ